MCVCFMQGCGSWVVNKDTTAVTNGAGIAAGWTICGSNPGREKRCFLFSKTSLGQPSFRWVWGFFLGVQRLEHDAEHSRAYGAQAKNEWSCTSTPPVCLHDVDRESVDAWIRKFDRSRHVLAFCVRGWANLYGIENSTEIKIRKICFFVPCFCLFFVCVFPVTFFSVWCQLEYWTLYLCCLQCQESHNHCSLP